MQHPERTRRPRLVHAFWVLTAALTLAGCAESTEDDPAQPAPDTAQPDTGEPDSTQPGTAQPDAGNEATSPVETDEPQSTQFTIAGTGDILIHGPLIDTAAALAEDADYAFAPMMGGVRDLISGADLALCGLEVPIAPEGVEPSGYPVFAAPPELAGDLAAVGFDGCSTANNHSLDQGTAGAERTLEVFDAAGLGHAGTARTEAEATRPQLYTMERGGREVTVAHLATSMLHNQQYRPQDDELWRVSDVSPQELTDQATQAREDGADIVVASVHWGEEYVDAPNQEQREYGEQLAADGAIDVVFGSHSHTPQPVEQLDGGPSDEGMWVVWSMGNFLSNQDEACCVVETASGTVVYATVEATDDDARVTGFDWLPVTVDRGPTDEELHRGIWPLQELAEGDVPERVQLSERTVDERWSRLLDVMTEQNLREHPPTPTGAEPTVVPRGD
ncbi:CapA family protein [Nesterenkonia sp. CF4.4]|uniref:CapA family protein n=1 Tax=Nesterenkonia sp. CF4.4 TaxID=3373079 RepID=UPI003EE4807F